MKFEDDITDIDLVVLAPSQVDEQSHNEQVIEREVMTTDVMPQDIAGQVEVNYTDAATGN